MHSAPPPPHPHPMICVCLSACICFKDRLPDRHSCLNLDPCIIKVQSINQSLSLCMGEGSMAGAETSFGEGGGGI